MQQQVGLHDLFQRRLEGFDELVRKTPHKAHRVREYCRPEARHIDAPQRRVERGKNLVGRKHTRLGNSVEQGRLASVRVADHSNQWQLRALPRPPGLRARSTHRIEAFANLGDSALQQALIQFELFFTRTAQTDTALFPIEVTPAANEARCHVFELRKLYLQLALVRTGALRKDVEDQARPRQYASL